MKPRIVIARAVPQAVAARASRDFDALLSQDDIPDSNEVLARVARHQAEGLLVGATVKLDAATIARMPDCLRIIATLSAGFEHVDVAAARARGIVVTNAPEGPTECTADLAMMLLLCAARRAGEYNDLMRAGWRRVLGLGEMLGLKVSGKTIGIYGMGRIGREMAQRARGFGMKVLYHNRTRLPPELEQGARYFDDFHAMLPYCEFLSLHAPASASTRHVIDRAALALLPPRAVLVNTARGQLVDEEALLDALQSERLAAAGLDVFASEPAFDQRFATLPNVFLTPHAASATIETRNAMGFCALDNLEAVLAGREPLTPVA
ncbi:2-hydroxyacid dehydrogenase [Paludibacterium yongneupense]|uniref:2-hydroxyacid dehydrogenase n=1 Tax=Paludibacterium yongneupense TaxID=400061 RepID=UPI0004281847|nr:D-glycerate dehydrogenase [Paludibacterium yongneupense]